MTTMRDDSLPHQIRLTFHCPETVTHIAVSCTCMATGGNAAGPTYQPIEVRNRWDDPDEPMRIWREHVAQAAAKKAVPA